MAQAYDRRSPVDLRRLEPRGFRDQGLPRARRARHRSKLRTTPTATPTEGHHEHTQLSNETATEAAVAATATAQKFEVTTLPVADVDRAKAFYQRLGWRLDIDFEPAPDTRGVQFTPPGSPASIQFGEGIDDDDRARCRA